MISGQTRYHAGLAAEDCVARHYESRGIHLAARRWRGRAGEIDLVMRQGSSVVFVEVKKSATHARAAERVLPRQIRRLEQAALEFLVSEPAGSDTDCRFDVALVDGFGRVEILENAFAA